MEDLKDLVVSIDTFGLERAAKRATKATKKAGKAIRVLQAALTDFGVFVEDVADVSVGVNTDPKTALDEPLVYKLAERTEKFETAVKDASDKANEKSAELEAKQKPLRDIQFVLRKFGNTAHDLCQLIHAGILTPNEVRIASGLPTLPGVAAAA